MYYVDGGEEVTGDALYLRDAASVRELFTTTLSIFLLKYTE
jgi:hypothetical protein